MKLKKHLFIYWYMIFAHLGAFKYFFYVKLLLGIFLLLLIISFSKPLIEEFKLRKNIWTINYLYIFFVSVFCQNFFSYSLSFFFGTIIFYLILSFLAKPTEKIKEYFFLGLNHGIKLNIVYAVLANFLWQLNFDISSYIFYDLLNLTVSEKPFVYSANFAGFPINRIAGLSWDPLYLGMISAIGAVIFFNSRSRLWLVLALFVLINTYSLTAIISLIIVCTIYILYYFTRISPLIFASIIIISIFSSITLLYYSGLIPLFGVSMGRRLVYYGSIIPTFQNGTLINLLFGLNPFTSGNHFLETLRFGDADQYYEWMFRFVDNSKPWNIEIDFVNIILGRGMIGILLFLSLIVLSWYRIGSKERSILALYLFGMLFYSYQYSMVLNLMLIVFAQRKLKDKKNYV
jgi:hypothetical protein